MEKRKKGKKESKKSEKMTVIFEPSPELLREIEKEEKGKLEALPRHKIVRQPTGDELRLSREEISELRVLADAQDPKRPHRDVEIVPPTIHHEPPARKR